MNKQEFLAKIRLVNELVKEISKADFFDVQALDILDSLHSLDKRMAKIMVDECNITDYDGTKKKESIIKKVDSILKPLNISYEWTDNLCCPLSLKLKNYSNFLDGETKLSW